MIIVVPLWFAVPCIWTLVRHTWYAYSVVVFVNIDVMVPNLGTNAVLHPGIFNDLHCSPILTNFSLNPGGGGVTNWMHHSEKKASCMLHTLVLVVGSCTMLLTSSPHSSAMWLHTGSSRVRHTLRFNALEHTDSFTHQAHAVWR